MEFQMPRTMSLILSWFSEAFSRASYKLFSAFIVGLIQLGREAILLFGPTLSSSFLQRSLSSFTRFLEKNAWAMEEIFLIALTRFFHTLRIKGYSPLFLLGDDTVMEKTGKKIPGSAWYIELFPKPGHHLWPPMVRSIILRWVLSSLVHSQPPHHLIERGSANSKIFRDFGDVSFVF
jgi:hypothetical protein